MQIETTIPRITAAHAKIRAIFGSMTEVIIIEAMNSTGARTSILIDI